MGREVDDTVPVMVVVAPSHVFSLRVAVWIVRDAGKGLADVRGLSGKLPQVALSRDVPVDSKGRVTVSGEAWFMAPVPVVGKMPPGSSRHRRSLATPFSELSRVIPIKVQVEQPL